MRLTQQIAFALPLTVFLCGCASSTAFGDRRQNDPGCYIYYDEQSIQRELEATPDCCTSLSQVASEPIAADAPTWLGLIRTSPVYTFSSGKSRFAAVSLPEAVKAKHLRIQPQISGRTTTARTCAEHKTAIFVGDGSERYRAIEPVVSFVSASGEVLASSVRSASPDPGDFFRAPIPAGAVIAVIHTDPTRYGADKRIRVKPESTGLPGYVGSVALRGPSVAATMVTATGIFVVDFVD